MDLAAESPRFIKDMENLIYLRPDVFPFPGACGVEFVSLLFWRTMLWIVGGFIVLVCVDRLTEWIRLRIKGVFGKLVSGCTLLACFAVVPMAFFKGYISAPKCEFIIQWNRLFSVTEVVLLSAIVLMFTKWRVNKMKQRSDRGLYFSSLRAGTWLLAVVGVGVIISSLGWQRVAYRPMWASMVEFVASLAVVSVALALMWQRAWRSKGWKSAVSKATWLVVFACVITGWIVLLGLWGLISNSCA